MTRLENWSIMNKDNNLYSPPELREYCLQGYIYDDVRFIDGSFIRTGTLQELNLEEGFAQTKRTHYILGEMSLDYKEWVDTQGYTVKSFKVEL